MFSRPALLKLTIKPALNYFKVDSAAHIHVCCLKNIKLPTRTNDVRRVNSSITSSFSPVLQARHNSSSTSIENSNDRLAGLDPIPEPPSVATPGTPTDMTTAVKSGRISAESSSIENSYDSASNTFPDVYRVAMEVFSSFPLEEDLAVARASKPASKTSYEPSETGPDIYKTAMEIWSDPATSSVDDGTSVGIENVTFDSANLSKLPGGSSSESDYVSIFDSLPEAPAVNSPVSKTEGFGHETPFSELGLGGWSPPGIVQNCMEFFHVDLGLPWWQAVVVGTLIIRICMFPIVILSQRNVAKLNNNMPEMQHIQARITEARQRGDKLEAARMSGELMKFMSEKGVNPLKNMLPPLCQAPIFISVFWGLRKMANLPVESLKTGGTLWFLDLTVPDQFYLLPIITSATLFLTVKLGAEGAPPTSQNMHLMKYLMLGLPVIVLPFTISFPGLILVYWTTSNFASLVQVGVIKIPKVREYLKIDKLVRHSPTNLAIKDKGFVGNVKEAWNNIKITSELQERERVDRMAFMKAGREPIKKTYKYDPTKVKPAIQAKKAS